MAVSRAAFSGISGTTRGRNLQAWSPTAIGGTVNDAGGYRIHTFSSVGTNSFQVISGLSSVEYLLVGGGGGASYGGGGAGGMLSGSSSVSSNSYETIVGGGGSFAVNARANR